MVDKNYLTMNTVASPVGRRVMTKLTPKTPSPLRRQGPSLTTNDAAKSWMPAFAGRTDGVNVELSAVSP
jgi:hypothetical protein